jgi:hypothetical protein
MEVHLAGAALIRGDRRTNGRDKTNMLISQPCKSPKPTVGFIL